MVGQDALGEYILNDCRENGIDPAFISVSPGTSTSYTDVMTEVDGGRRTFFHNRGANATWDGSDIDFPEVRRGYFIWVIFCYWMQLTKRMRSMALWVLLFLPRPVSPGLKQV